MYKSQTIYRCESCDNDYIIVGFGMTVIEAEKMALDHLSTYKIEHSNLRGHQILKMENDVYNENIELFIKDAFN